MSAKFNILVTGGAGYVGSHTVIDLLEHGHEVIVVDNLCNTYCADGERLPESLKRVQEITGKSLVFYDVDIRNKDDLSAVFKKHKIDCVAHFAALKAVGESCVKPLLYYQNNITGTSVLLEVMIQNNVFRFLYSSSATVYGTPQSLPISENHITGLGCTNPYGKSKYFVEEILRDLCVSDQRFGVISLRYFNPVGAHQSGRIGEDPNGIPNNLMPYIAQVAVGRRDVVTVYGSDYDTVDGTGVRDYIHISDLSLGHVKAVDMLTSPKFKGWKAYNLGTGNGYSVLEVIKAFSKSCGHEVKYKIGDRRVGDIASCYADPTLANKELKWKAQKTLQNMCDDAWKWQKMNPNGYKSLN
uniref:UDP-glucose 4-epimerase n=1 Tax=Xenopsylla cheopis TaxID=163159 RepID=A0A6M2DLC5_XENCH